MPRKHLRHIGVVCGTLLIELLCSLLLKPMHPAVKAQHISINTGWQPERRAPRQDTLSEFQSTDFYRVIINNNLFRSLG